ncbi:MAG: hypothetical protein U1F52_05410 [Burkholderiales bacterium]
MSDFLDALRVQRWDDHRFYHQSRVNQTLHFVSAASFIVAYGFLLVDPAISALIGWLVSMTTRQSGHFFFEPQGYDPVNRVTHEYKEAVKVGYNLKRKIVLIALWALLPLVLLAEPSLFGLLVPHASAAAFVHNAGWVWFALGVGGLMFRTVHLFFLRDVRTGLVWLTKILTDPFHDLLLYRRAPLHLMRGERIDPMHHVQGP